MAFTIIEYWILGGLMFIMFASAAIVTFVQMNKRIWDHSYNLLTKPAGYWVIKRGKCKLINFGDGGEQVFLLRRQNKFRTAYNKFIANKTILWVEGDDGYWYNCTFGDFNKALLEVGIKPVDRDARYANTVIRKGIENRYNTKSFIEKYGMYIFGGILLLMVIGYGVSTYYTAKINKDARAQDHDAQLKMAEIQLQITQENKNILASIANIKDERGSGYVQTVATEPIREVNSTT